MSRIRIALDGTVRGLWTDDVDWQELGKSAVRRASHVEFCEKKQQWYVRGCRRCNALHNVVPKIIARRFDRILYWADTRSDALAWEQEHFGPGGPGWQP